MYYDWTWPHLMKILLLSMRNFPQAIFACIFRMGASYSYRWRSASLYPTVWVLTLG